MTLIYITVRKLGSEDVEANLEFSGKDWMQALDDAYDWLKQNRKSTHTYYVWC